MVASDRPSISSEIFDSESNRNNTDHRLTSRSVRSFVIRNGRLTKAQETALDDLLPHFGIPYSDSPVSLESAFGNTNPVWLEIGFGNGDALIDMATRYPEVNLLGVEVHAPGVGHVLQGIAKQELTNVRIIQHDAMDVLQNMLIAGSLARVLLFCPDPWHKKRHHKRRIVQTEFADAVSHALVPGGLLHCATDVADYADWMLEVLNPISDFRNLSADSTLVEQPEWRASTRFERRGNQLGHVMHDMLFEKI